MHCKFFKLFFNIIYIYIYIWILCFHMLAQILHRCWILRWTWLVCAVETHVFRTCIEIGTDTSSCCRNRIFYCPHAHALLQRRLSSKLHRTNEIHLKLLGFPSCGRTCYRRWLLIQSIDQSWSGCWERPNIYPIYPQIQSNRQNSWGRIRKLEPNIYIYCI